MTSSSLTPYKLESNETPAILNGSDNESDTPSTDQTQQPISSGSVTMTTSAVVVNSVYLTIGAVGLFGNLFVVIVILSLTNMRRKVTNIFIINQSLIDLATSVVLIVTAGTAWLGTWPLNANSLADQLLCRVWLATDLLWGLMMSSTYSVLALTVERYLHFSTEKKQAVFQKRLI